MRTSNTHPRVYLLPRLQDILFISIFVAALLMGPLMLNLDGDLPRHILTGKLVTETKTIPSSEPFAYPYQGKPFTSHAHDWITDSIFYLIYKFSGLTGLAILSALLLASTFTLLYAYVSKQTGLRLPTLFLVIWGAGVTSLNWVTRPFLFSMLFLAIWLIWLDKLNKSEKIKIWYFPAVMLLWANMHGEFITGFLVLLAYGGGWTWDFLFNRPLAQKRTGFNILLASALSFLASLLNPAGLAPWKTMLGFVGNSYLMDV